MTNRPTDHLLERLFELGQAIDIGQPINVFDGGQVGLGSDCEAKERKMNDKDREDPQPGHGKGPQDHGGRPVKPGIPSAASGLNG